MIKLPSDNRISLWKLSVLTLIQNNRVSKNSGSKKMINKQNPSEDINTEAIPENYDPTTSKFVTEIETNRNGDQKMVHSDRNVKQIQQKYQQQ